MRRKRKRRIVSQTNPRKTMAVNIKKAKINGQMTNFTLIRTPRKVGISTTSKSIKQAAEEAGRKSALEFKYTSGKVQTDR